jgi:spermidine/putrescine-binding protein
MLSKALTTSYDLFAPTDYAIKSLYQSKKIQKLDLDILEKINFDTTNQSFNKGSSNRRFVDE